MMMPPPSFQQPTPMHAFDDYSSDNHRPNPSSDPILPSSSGDFGAFKFALPNSNGYGTTDGEANQRPTSNLFGGTSPKRNRQTIDSRVNEMHSPKRRDSANFASNNHQLEAAVSSAQDDDLIDFNTSLFKADDGEKAINGASSTDSKQRSNDLVTSHANPGNFWKIYFLKL